MGICPSWPLSLKKFWQSFIYYSSIKSTCVIVEVQALLLEAPFPMDQTAASKNIRIDLRCLSEGVNHHGHDP
jgi:hypothetical protein